MATLYELKMSLHTVGAELREVNDQLIKKAGDPTVSLDDVTGLETKKAQLQKRFNIIQA